MGLDWLIESTIEAAIDIFIRLGMPVGMLITVSGIETCSRDLLTKLFNLKRFQVVTFTLKALAFFVFVGCDSAVLSSSSEYF